MDYSAMNAACMRVWGEPVTYTHADHSDPFTVTVIWSDGQRGGQAPRQHDIVFVLLSDFAQLPAAKDQITRSGDKYQVVGNPEFDGTQTPGVPLSGGAYLQARLLERSS